ncbi:TadE/TadG family type IV pilus assembly protein [Demequina sp. NBRC 110057]|uniref:TadE/TadG family type IV pilus assembly protein n=1 Tax=Demequina sp. NBRC 110057 TaxID=1570346 RepID=UPI000A017EB5|nr:TadE/TadG family type IV pilus assembly protein [Demequina sp. NBRC 110057]
MVSRAASWRDDRGSATADFVMIAALVVVIALALLQLVLAMHVRNTLLSSAQEGARHAAAADRGVAEGAARALEVAAASIPGTRASAGADATTVDGAPAVRVTMTAPVPMLGWWGPVDVTVSARALEEEQ